MLKAGRVLVPNFQHRVMLGIGSFVGILLLVGWVIINEPARMDVFTQQFQGRSIENGAATFLSACATCHGADGRGISGRAPGLDNPMLFLKDNPVKLSQTKIDGLNTDLQTAQGQLDAYTKNAKALADAQAALQAAASGSDAAKQAQAQIDALKTQMANLDQAKLQQKVDDLTAQIKAEQSNHDNLIKQGWDPNRDVRLKEVNWGGTLQNYLEATISGGRPLSSGYFPQPMPNWAQQFGGPLRQDEIQDVVAYVMNFQYEAVKLTPNDVNQQFVLPVMPGAAATPSGPVLGMDADPLKLTLKPGDPAKGQALYQSLGCVTCHLQGQVGPITAGTMTRIVNIRLKDPANANKTAEQYIAESILRPNAYIVPNFSADIMPKTFPTKLTLDDLDNLIAFLESQK